MDTYYSTESVYFVFWLIWLFAYQKEMEIFSFWRDIFVILRENWYFLGQKCTKTNQNISQLREVLMMFAGNLTFFQGLPVCLEFFFGDYQITMVTTC